MRAKAFILFLFSVSLSFSQGIFDKNNKKELVDILYTAREKGASKKQLHTIISRYKRKKLYTYLYKENTTDLSYSEFSKEYSQDSDKQKKLFDYLSKENLTDLDSKMFFSQYFGDLNQKTFKTEKKEISNIELVLEETHREELDGIVEKMILNNESDESIQSVVNYFKTEYGKPKNKIRVNAFFTPILIEQLGGILAILFVLFTFYIIYKKRKLLKRKLNQFINSKFFIYILELVLPTLFSALTLFFVEQKSDRECSFDEEGIIYAFGYFYFFIILVEWLRRYKAKEKNILLKTTSILVYCFLFF